MRFPFFLSYCRARAGLVFGLFLFSPIGSAAITTEHPYPGITLITRHETSPRNFTAHVVQIDLATPGLRFKLTPHSGERETTRQTTLDFLQKEHAQFAINAHFFAPYPSAETASNLIGFAASEGKIYSDFESPEQAYALVADAPAINIDRENHATIIHRKDDRANIWTAVSGSAQIITAGQPTVPHYRDPNHPDGLLTEGGPNTHFSNKDSWYDRPNARTAIAIADEGKILVLFVVNGRESVNRPPNGRESVNSSTDGRESVNPGSLGLTIPEMAALLITDYHATDALNLDGGGSSTLAMEDPSTHTPTIVNVSGDNPKGRSVASNLAVFVPRQKP